MENVFVRARWSIAARQPYARVAGVIGAVAWGTLTAVLIAYIGVLTWGPAVRAPNGLVTQVIAQKVVAIIAVSMFAYFAAEGERVRKAIGRLA